MLEGNLDARQASLKVKISFNPWKHRKGTFEGGEGAYDLSLQRNGRKIKGTFTGDYNGQKVEGEVEGYFLEELPVALQAENL